VNLVSTLRRYRGDDLLTNRCILAIYDSLLGAGETKGAAVSFLNRRMTESEVQTVVSTLPENERKVFMEAYLWWRNQTYALSHPAFVADQGTSDGRENPKPVDIYTGVNRSAVEQYENEIARLEAGSKGLQEDNDTLRLSLSGKDDEIARLGGEKAEMEQYIVELKRELEACQAHLLALKSEYESKLREKTAQHDETVQGYFKELDEARTMGKCLQEKIVRIEKLLPNVHRLVEEVLQVGADSTVTEEGVQRLFLNLCALPTNSASSVKVRNWATAVNDSINAAIVTGGSALDDLRKRVEDYVNGKVSHFSMTWSLVGDLYDSTLHDAQSNDNGNNVIKVESPLVVSLPDQKVIRKADVDIG